MDNATPLSSNPWRENVNKPLALQVLLISVWLRGCHTFLQGDTDILESIGAPNNPEMCAWSVLVYPAWSHRRTLMSLSFTASIRLPRCGVDFPNMPIRDGDIDCSSVVYIVTFRTWCNKRTMVFSIMDQQWYPVSWTNIATSFKDNPWNGLIDEMLVLTCFLWTWYMFINW